MKPPARSRTVCLRPLKPGRGGVPRQLGHRLRMTRVSRVSSQSLIVQPRPRWPTKLSEEDQELDEDLDEDSDDDGWDEDSDDDGF